MGARHAEVSLGAGAKGQRRLWLLRRSVTFQFHRALHRHGDRPLRIGCKESALDLQQGDIDGVP